MHYHAERGNDQAAAAVEDRSSRSAWECRQGRSAFRFWKVTQSVTGCITTQSVGTIRRRRRWKIVPHAPRGNAARDAPRSALEGDAERHGMHYHAERGNDKGAAAVEDRSSRSAWECRQGRSAFRFWKVTQSVTGCITTQSVGTIRLRRRWKIVPHAPRGNAARDAPRSALEGDAERHGMHYHAERGNDQAAAAVEDRSSRSAWECRQGRSAFRFWKVTQSVTGCITTQSVGTIRVRRRWKIVPHAPRGNAARDAPRSASGR